MYNKQGQSQTGPDAFLIGGFAVALGAMGWWKSHVHFVLKWYFNHYETIYLSIAAALLIPLGVIIYYIKKKTKKIKDRADLLGPHWEQSDSNIFVGKTSDGVEIHLSDELRSTHVQIIGTTGRGKTQSVVIPWTLRDLYRGRSVLLIDGKGSRDVPIEIRSALRKWNIEASVFEFNLDDPKQSITINPLRDGSPQQITDRIFSSFEFAEPFYKSLQYNICGYQVQLIHELGEVVTFKRMHEFLNDEVKLTQGMQKLKEGELKKALLEYLKTPAIERKKNLLGLASQIAPFATGEVSAFINGGDNEVGLKDILIKSDGAKLLMMSIPTLKYQKIGHQIGKLILQDLAFCIGEREKLDNKKFASVFLDEFAEFAYDGFVSVLSKARSAKVGLHLSHQSMGDLSRVSPDFANSVVTNTNIKCIMGLNDPETADFFARHLGTFTQEKFTEQMDDEGFMKGRRKTGRGSMREVESYKVHPNDLKNFTQGRGVIHVPTLRGNMTEVVQFQNIGG